MALRINFVALILLAAVLIGLFVFAGRIARKHGWGIVLAVPALLIVAAFFALFALRASPRVMTGTAVAEVALPAKPLPAEQLPVAEALSPDFHQELNADAYPSARSAISALTRRLLDSLDRLVPDNVKLKALAIEEEMRPGFSHRISPELLATAAETARARLPGITVGLLENMKVRAGEGEMVATLRLREEPVTSDEVWVHATLTGTTPNSPGSNGLNDQAHALNKPWVETPWPASATDGSQPASEWSNGRLRFVVHSELSSSQSEARTQARGLAVDRLRPMIEGRLGRSISNSERSWLSKQLQMDIDAGRLQGDRFEQKIAKPYGQVWRCSMLVDSPEGEIAHLTSGYLRQLNIQRAGWRHTLLMGAGLVVGIIVLYLFLNMATKGYYMWSLRVAGVVAVAAGIVFVLTVA